MRNNNIFRPGELDVTFCALAVLGKYIEARGIEQALIEGGLYTACSVSKIVQGKQYYGALEAHMSTLLTFYQLYFNRFPQLYPGYKKLVFEISENLRKSYGQTVASSDTSLLYCVMRYSCTKTVT